MPKVEIDVKSTSPTLREFDLSPQEEEQFSSQLNNVLGYIEKLQEVDVSEVAPTAHAFPLVNVMRPDEVRPSINREEILSNAPAHANGLFLVPKIVE